jgi:hypothetical protein
MCEKHSTGDVAQLGTDDEDAGRVLGQPLERRPTVVDFLDAEVTGERCPQPAAAVEIAISDEDSIRPHERQGSDLGDLVGPFPRHALVMVASLA